MWECFFNNERPQGAQEGKTPYEALREILRQKSTFQATRHITEQDWNGAGAPNKNELEVSPGGMTMIDRLD